MKKKKVKHTIYAILWMLIWLVAIGLGSTSVSVALKDLSVYRAIYTVLILITIWLSGQKFIDNLFKVMAYKAIEKERENKDGYQ